MVTHNYVRPDNDPCNLEDYEAVYKRYPRKVGKQAAFKKLKTQFKTVKKLRLLYKATVNFDAYCKKENLEAKFIPHFSTFVNSKWEDWVDPEEKSSKETQKKSVVYFSSDDIKPVETLQDDEVKDRIKQIRSMIKTKSMRG